MTRQVKPALGISTIDIGALVLPLLIQLTEAMSDNSST